MPKKPTNHNPDDKSQIEQDIETPVFSDIFLSSSADEYDDASGDNLIRRIYNIISDAKSSPDQWKKTPFGLLAQMIDNFARICKQRGIYEENESRINSLSEFARMNLERISLVKKKMNDIDVRNFQENGQYLSSKITLRFGDEIDYLYPFSGGKFIEDREFRIQNYLLRENIPRKFHTLIRKIVFAAIDHPEMTENEIKDVALRPDEYRDFGKSIDIDFHLATTDYLSENNKLYSQALARAKSQGRDYNIIIHLCAVWGEFIKRGLLTRPLLYQGKGSKYGDRSAYDALANWLKRDENDLRKSLNEALECDGSYDIPDRSSVARQSSRLTPEQLKEAGRERSLAQRARKKGSSSRDR